MTDSLLIRDDDAVRVLTLNRPRVLNAVDADLSAALHEALVTADADTSVRCIVLTAAGERAFCAGGDLKQLAARAGSGGSPVDSEEPRLITAALRHRPATPVVAAVNGLAYGGGLEILLACDLVVAADHATFALPEVGRGRVAAGGGLVQLPRVVGPRRALQLILTGTPIDAATALAWGLVNQVVPTDQLPAAAMALARTIAGNAPVAVRVSKQTVLTAVTAGDDVAAQANEAAFETARRSPDAAEGLRAFAEGRPPVWAGSAE